MGDRGYYRPLYHSRLGAHLGKILFTNFASNSQLIISVSEFGKALIWNSEGEVVLDLNIDSLAVTIAFFSPDSKFVIATYRDGYARLWDLQNFTYKVLGSPSPSLKHAYFSNDGKAILTIPWKGKLRVWDIDGKLIAGLGNSESINLKGDFSSREKKVLIIEKDEVILHDYSTGIEISLLENNNKVSSGFFSPNGKLVLLKGYDSTFKLYSSEGDSITEILDVSKAYISPDSKWILGTYSHLDTIAPKTVLWSRTGEKVAELLGHNKPVLYAEFSSDSRLLLTSSNDSTAIIWDLEGNIIAKLENHQDRISFGNFSKEGQRIITPSWDGSAKVWDTSGRLISDLSQHSEAIIYAEISPDLNWRMTAPLDSSIYVYSQKGELIKDLPLNMPDIHSATFTPDGKFLVLKNDSIIELYDLQKETKSLTFRTKNIIFSPDTSLLLTFGGRAPTRLFNLNGELLLELESNQKNFRPDPSFSSNSKYILYENDQSIKVITPQGEVKCIIDRTWAKLLHLEFSPDDQLILSTELDSTIRIWSLSGNLVQEIKNFHPGEKAHFSLDGKFIFSKYHDDSGHIRIWNLQGQIIADIDQENTQVFFIAFVPKSNLFAARSLQTFKLWSMDGSLLLNLSRDSKYSSAFSISPNGTHVLSYANDNKLELYGLHGSHLYTMNQHQGDINHATFSPDGNLILSHSKDNTVKLWNLDGELIANFAEHTDQIISATFSPDSKYVLTCSKDQSLKLWPTPLTIYNWLRSSQCPIAILSENEKEIYGLEYK